LTIYPAQFILAGFFFEERVHSLMKKEMPTAALHTLGCRLNQAETAIIAANLQKQGYEIVPYGNKADLTVINTCTVTEQADAKCRQAVRKSIRQNPETYVAVIGCYAQMAVETISKIDGVDLIMGNEHKMKLPDYLDDSLQKNVQPQVVHSPKISKESFVIESVGLFDTATRANLKIQDGCSFVCSFCIIATARGPARSREYQDILKEARQLAQDGFKEIVLTGVNIGTYTHNGKNFLDLLQDLEQVHGIERIRISSIEPTTVSKELIDYMANSVKICPHLHIPLQSGDDQILESMRRKHSADFFRKIVEYAATRIPDLGIGTDVMVGYPGEDENAFIETKKILSDLPISYFHVFNYSDRKGTTAYNLKPKVAFAVKKERARIMAEVGHRQKNKFAQSFIGRAVNVLFESSHEGNWEGWTGNYIRVRVKDDTELNNQIRPVIIKSVQGGIALGEIE